MSANVKEFSVQVELGCTLQITMSDGSTNWIKPASLAGQKWDGVPDDQQVAEAFARMNEVVDSIIDTIIQTTNDKLQEVVK